MEPQGSLDLLVIQGLEEQMELVALRDLRDKLATLVKLGLLGLRVFQDQLDLREQQDLLD